MYIFVVSVLCALMLGMVHYMVFADLLECVVVTFLLFVAIDSGLRALMNKPSWILRVSKIGDSRKKRARQSMPKKH